MIVYITPARQQVCVDLNDLARRVPVRALPSWPSQKQKQKNWAHALNRGPNRAPTWPSRLRQIAGPASEEEVSKRLRYARDILTHLVSPTAGAAATVPAGDGLVEGSPVQASM